MTAEQLRELESHLREGLRDLSAKGLSTEEAFWIVTRRLGSSRSLANEFSKSDPASVWRIRVFWMATGLFVGNVWFALNHAIAQCSRWLADQSGFDIFPLIHTLFAVINSYLTQFALSTVGIGIALFLLARGKFQIILQKIGGRCRSRLTLALHVFGLALGTLALSYLASSIQASSMGFSAKLWSHILYNALFPLIIAIIIVTLAPLQRARRCEGR